LISMVGKRAISLHDERKNQWNRHFWPTFGTAVSNTVKSHNYFINYLHQFFVFLLFLLARCSLVALVCWWAIEVGWKYAKMRIWSQFIVFLILVQNTSQVASGEHF
jgi:hypothetical protein